jgi:hypothetical protein
MGAKTKAAAAVALLALLGGAVWFESRSAAPAAPAVPSVAAEIATAPSPAEPPHRADRPVERVAVAPQSSAPAPVAIAADRIEGRVVDQDGNGVAGVWLQLHKPDLDKIAPSATSGGDGSFVLSGVDSGDWDLMFTPPKPYDEWQVPDEYLPVNGGRGGVVVRFERIPPGIARITADVVDADTGAGVMPTEAMLLRAVPNGRSHQPGHGPWRLDQGVASVDRVRAGTWRLWVNFADHPPAVTTVTVAPGQTDVAARVVAGRTGTISGVVSPGGVRVMMIGVQGADDLCGAPQWAGYSNVDMYNAARVQPDGTFQLPNLRPGRHRLIAHADGWLGETVVDLPSGGEARAAINLTRAAEVEFELADPSPSKTLRWEVAQGDGPWELVMILGEQKGKRAHLRRTVPPGRVRWRVRFQASSFYSPRVAAQTAEGEVECRAGDVIHVSVPVRPVK